MVEHAVQNQVHAAAIQRGDQGEEFRRLTGIKSRSAEKILSDFILCGLITYEASEKGIFYRLSNEFGPGV